MMVFLFLRKKVLKNQMQISFVVIVLSLHSSDSLALLLSMTSQKFFIFLDYLKALVLLL